MQTIKEKIIEANPQAVDVVVSTVWDLDKCKFTNRTAVKKLANRLHENHPFCNVFVVCGAKRGLHHTPTEVVVVVLPQDLTLDNVGRDYWSL